MSVPSPYQRHEFPRNKARSLMSAFVSLAAFGGSVVALIVVIIGGVWVPESPESLIFLLFALLGPPGFLGLAGYFFWQAAAGKPVLVVDMKGIYTSHCGVGLIPWTEVAGLQEVNSQNGDILVVLLRDPVKWYMNLNGARQGAVQHEVRRYEGITIPEKVLPCKVVEVLDQIRSYTEFQIDQHRVKPQP